MERIVPQARHRFEAKSSVDRLRHSLADVRRLLINPLASPSRSLRPYVKTLFQNETKRYENGWGVKTGRLIINNFQTTKRHDRTISFNDLAVVINRSPERLRTPTNTSKPKIPSIGAWPMDFRPPSGNRYKLSATEAFGNQRKPTEGNGSQRKAIDQRLT